MQQYCVFLKQVYFRRSFIQMDDLKSLFIDLKFQQVDTVLATGNVIFNTPKPDIYPFIKKALAQYYAFDIDIFIKTFEEIKFILDHNPYNLSKEFYTQTFICDDGFEQVLLEEFAKIRPLDQEQACLQQGRLYWHYPKATRAQGKFQKILARESLKHQFTLRMVGRYSTKGLHPNALIRFETTSLGPAPPKDYLAPQL